MMFNIENILILLFIKKVFLKYDYHIMKNFYSLLHLMEQLYVVMHIVLNNYIY